MMAHLKEKKNHAEPFTFKFSDISNNYLGEMLREKRPRCSIVVWFLLFLVMTGFCLYIVVQLLSGYYEYDSYNLEYSRLAHKYTLPAITICNVNPLNFTKLDKRGIYPAYRDWISVVGKRNSSSNDEKPEPNEDLDDLDINTKFKMNINESVVSQLTYFAKEPRDYMEFTSFAYTANGECMEMNDNEELVQRVNGAIGGLTIVLDALTGDYLPETETAGFLVTLRMPNETVLSQEFGFLVAPGYQHSINLRTRKVTRLTEPWGNCENTKDHFDEEGLLSFKKCYLNQMLWMYPKLRDLGCGCYPWFFYERYFNDPEDSKYEPNIEWKLIKYWTEELPEEFRFNFTDTCKYEDSSYRPNSGQIREESGVVTVEECVEICKNDTSCRYFLFTDTANDVLDANKCVLYKGGADMEIIPTKVIVTGLVWGDTQCFNMEKCSVSSDASCLNKIMNALMEAEEEDVDENGKSKTPPTCYEPCTYLEYSYDLSRGEFPTRKYWDGYLDKLVDNYDTYEDAKSNLLKLVFYTDQMSSIELEQTPSYEITSFIAELGGLTDLFIGFSFFTAYQFFEWLVTRVVRKLNTERRTMDNSDNVNVEDANL